TAIVSAALVAGCGGGGKKQQAPPSSGTNTGPGGTVTAEPTLGRLGGAETVLPGKITVTGKPGPISPDAAKPTQNQLKGVAGGPVCASAAVNPSSSNIGPVGAAILCLLNQERAAHGLAALHNNPKL